MAKIITIVFTAAITAFGIDRPLQFASLSNVISNERYRDGIALYAGLLCETNRMDKHEKYALYLNGGFCYAGLWRNDEADACYRYALQYADSSGRMQVIGALAKLAYVSQRYSDAKQWYIEMLASAAGNARAEALFYHGKVLVKLNEMTNARTSFSLLLREFPDHILRKNTEIELRKIK